MSSRRPNILLITTDQHRADCFSFARPDIKTPHMDALAARGTRFDRCYCPGPLCQPARASILTGMLPLTHGVRDNGIDLPDDMIERGFAQQLTNSGYKTALMGKAHLATQFTFEPTGRPECRHTAPKYYDDWFGPYMGFNHVELFIDGPVKWPYWEPPQGLHFTKWLFADGQGGAKNKLYDSGWHPSSKAQQTHIPDLPLPWHTSSWLGDRATNFIENHDKDDDPFMLWVSFPDPHHPFDAPEPYGRMYNPDDVDIPKHRDLDLSRRPWWHEASLTGTPDTTEEFRSIRENISRQSKLSERQLRDITANYFGMISLVDHNIGRIMAALTHKGIDQDTIVILTSDHGEFLGDHGLLFKGPMFYDSLIRVGLVAAGPGIDEGKVVQNVVSTADLAPTLIDFGGGAPEGYHGQSLTPALRPNGNTDDLRNMAHVEWGLDASRCGVDLDLRTVVTDRYRYTIELGSGDGELYDLTADPHEMDNLFYNIAYKDIRAELEGIRETRPNDIRAESLPIVGMC